MQNVIKNKTPAQPLYLFFPIKKRINFGLFIDDNKKALSTNKKTNKMDTGTETENLFKISAMELMLQ